MYDTVSRVPLMTGFPTMTLGLMVIRASSSALLMIVLVETKVSFHLRYGLIRVSRIRNNSMIGTIGQQVEFLQDRLSDQHLVAEHHSLILRVPAEDFKDDRL